MKALRFSLFLVSPLSVTSFGYDYSAAYRELQQEINADVIAVSDPPSMVPSDVPSAVPSGLPRVILSASQSMIPSDAPSMVPSDAPSMIPSAVPSLMAYDAPSFVLSSAPSSLPTVPAMNAESFEVPSSGNSAKTTSGVGMSALIAGSAAIVVALFAIGTALRRAGRSAVSTIYSEAVYSTASEEDAAAAAKQLTSVSYGHQDHEELFSVEAFPPESGNIPKDVTVSELNTIEI